MRIYIDFDDVLCETARALSDVAKEVFQRDVPYEQITEFNLEHAFSLSGDQIEQLMDHAHEIDFLEKLEPTPDAVDGVKQLLEMGHEVVIVTGRPSYCHEGSLRWMQRFGLASLEIIYVDKYGRAPKIQPGTVPPMLSLEEFNRLSFDIAIDDSPTALDLLSSRDNCRILIYDRPWNRDYISPGNMQRCCGWMDVLSAVCC